MVPKLWNWIFEFEDEIAPTWTIYLLLLAPQVQLKFQIGPITNIVKVQESYGILIFGAIANQLAIQISLVLANDKFLS